MSDTEQLESLPSSSSVIVHMLKIIATEKLARNLEWRSSVRDWRKRKEKLAQVPAKTQ